MEKKKKPVNPGIAIAAILPTTGLAIQALLAATGRSTVRVADGGASPDGARLVDEGVLEVGTVNIQADRFGMVTTRVTGRVVMRPSGRVVGADVVSVVTMTRLVGRMM